MFTRIAKKVREIFAPVKPKVTLETKPKLIMPPKDDDITQPL